uniref:Transmembrane protein n=1 Tax=Panagrolaimus sp. ES5 TaxID=591445 RepID=A0AC34F927_9BILA
MVGLTRYDGNSLRPLRTVGDPAVSIFPRVSLPGDGHLHEMNLLNRSTALNPAFQPPPGTYGHQTGQIHQGFLPGTTTIVDDVDPDWESILHNIQEIGIHRFLTLIKKVPAIGLLLISLWIVWGRGFNTVLEDVEKNMGIVGLVSGGITAVGVTLTAQHHSNNKNSAKYQTWRRIIVCSLNFLCSIAVIVFGIISLSDLHGKKENNPKMTFGSPIMSVNERTAHAGALTGVGLLIAIFSLLSLAFGISALMKVNKAEHKVKQAQRRQRSVEYLNPAYGTVDGW